MCNANDYTCSYALVLLLAFKVHISVRILHPATFAMTQNASFPPAFDAVASNFYYSTYVPDRYKKHHARTQLTAQERLINGSGEIYCEL